MRRIVIAIASILLYLPAIGSPSVFINGRKAACGECRNVSWIQTHAKPPFSVKIKGLDAADTFDVSPHARNVKVLKDRGAAQFTIERQGHYIITFGSGEKLFIFAEEKIHSPQGINVLKQNGIAADGSKNITEAVQSLIDTNAGKEIIFGKGTYLVSKLKIPSHSRIFLEEGAVIKADSETAELSGRTNGFIEINDAKDVIIRGNGTIDGQGTVIDNRMCTTRNILATNSREIMIEGIISLNPARWNTHILKCDGVLIKNCKLINDWSVKNTDGFDPDCSNDVAILDCFAHCSDDCVAIKTTDRLGKATNLKGVTVRGCVFETRKSALKVGTETLAASMSDILFENNDVVESDRGMALYIKDGTTIHDVTYRNNRFERNCPDACRMPYHIYILKRHKDSRVGAMYNILIEDCTFERAFPNKPSIENPHSARLEVDFKNLTLPE